MKALLLIPLAAICFSAPSAAAENWGPWETPAIREGQPPSGNSPGGPLQLVVHFYQRYISPVDGPRCPMYPTCSTYALQALAKHGPLTGVFLTVDRLYRENDPHEQQKPIVKWGYVRFYDPLENNDFWLGREQ